MRRFIYAVLAVVVIGCLAAVVFVWIIPANTSPVVEQLTLEAGSEMPKASAFLTEEASKTEISYATDVSTIDLSHVGTYEIEFNAKGKEWPSTLVVEDTVAPTAEAVDLTVGTNETLTAEDLVTDIDDATYVTCGFVQEPTLSEGDNSVEIFLKDEGGNTTRLTANVTLVVDHEAPVIDGVAPLTGFIDVPISYKAYVSVTDDYDENVTLDVDTSQVDPETPGTYPITYSATDFSGNTSTESTTITISEKPTDYVDESEVLELAQDVLDEIVTDDMTEKEVAQAIHKWVRSNVSYIMTSDKDSWTNGAYQGLTTGRGDCFVYYATSRALLTAAGIENLSVERSDTSEAFHYWNLVNCGDGWYHFDACPRYDDGYTFMWTDDQLDYYDRTSGYPYYYEFDHSLYPATPTEYFSMDD